MINKIKKKWFPQMILILLIILLSSNVFATKSIPFEWDELTYVTLDKKEFGVDEEITGKVGFANLEEYPSLGTKIVLHLVQGEYEYPSQFNNKENILFEQIIDVNFVLISDEKEFNFSFSNPGKGEYRVDAYMWIVKSKATGASNILYNPISSNFIVVGGEQKERAIINRNSTLFGDVSGPIGFLVEPNSEFNGVIVVDNPSNKIKSNLSVGIMICEWASPFCNSFVEQKFSMDSIPASERGAIEVKLRAPSVPSAYEIGLVLYEGDEIESIYKSRVIVGGGTAKVRKIGFGGVGKENYFIDLVLIGSPDHFTYPDFENFELKIKLIKETEEIFIEKKENVGIISTGEIMTKQFELGEFNPEKNEFSKICYSVEKEGIVFDEGCFEIDLNQILYEYELLYPKKIEVNYNYDEFSKTLFFSLSKKKINARVKIFDSDNTYFSEFIEASELIEKSIRVEKLNLFLLVDDLDLKEQQLIPINLELWGLDNIFGESLDSTQNILENKKCSGMVCGKNQVCDSLTEITVDGECCYTNCVEASASSLDLFGIPLITWLALIILVISLIMFNGVILKKRVKK